MLVDHFYVTMALIVSGWIAGMLVIVAVQRNPEFARKIFGNELYEKMEREEK